MKALITGVSGFVGTHLSKQLLSANYEVFGISRTAPKNKDVDFIACDINNADKLELIIDSIRPDEIYHLAGSAFIPYSYEQPIEAYGTIVNGTLALYEALRKLDIASKVLYVGSAEVYGESEGSPFTEKDLLKPMNPYAGAKACADLISEQYAKTYHMNIIRARPFNHTGPQQVADFVCSSFARQIADMEELNENIIKVGNIEVKRDFLDVRDVVNAYYLLMKFGLPGEAYNVCSNAAVPISEILEILFSASMVKDPVIVVDPKKLRVYEANVRVGDNTKLSNHTGWKPQYHLQDTMKEILGFWREENKLLRR